MNEYKSHDWINCIDAFKYPYEKDFDNGGHWIDCPNCGLKPKIWTFDNGESTACGCWKNTYHHFSIHSESIMSFYKRNKADVSDHDNDGLRKNWNHWCKTGEVLFEHAGKRKDGRW